MVQSSRFAQYTNCSKCSSSSSDQRAEATRKGRYALAALLPSHPQSMSAVMKLLLLTRLDKQVGGCDPAETEQVKGGRRRR